MVLGAVQFLLHVDVFAVRQVDDEDVVQLRTGLGITLWKKRRKKVDTIRLADKAHRSR